MATAFQTVARHEWRILRTDRTLNVLLAVFALAVMYAEVHASSSLHREQASLAEFLRVETGNVERSRQQNAATWSRIDRGELRTMTEFNNDPTLTPLFPYWEFQLQRSAVYPDSPLAFLAMGQRDMYPMAYHPSAPGQFYKEVIPSAEQNENPRHRMTGQFDLAFVIMYLLPLLIVAVSYDLLASERESGTLPLLLAQPLTLRTILLAKLTVRVALISATTLCVVVGASLVTVRGWPGAESLVGFAVWLLAILIYGAAWFGISVVVNAIGRSAAANAVVLAVCWLVLVLVIPAAARFAAKVLYPIPPRSALRDSKRDAQLRAGVDVWEEGVKELDDPDSRTSHIVAEYLHDNPALRLVEPPAPNQEFTWVINEDFRNVSPAWRGRVHQQRFHLVYSARTAWIKRLVAPDQARFDRAYARQHEFFALASSLSPQSLVERVFTTLSGTSVEQHDRFLEQVERNHDQWMYFFTKRSLAGEMLRPEDFDRFPYFSFQPESLSERLSGIAIPIATLVMCAMAVTGFGLIQILKYPIVG